MRTRLTPKVAEQHGVSTALLGAALAVALVVAVVTFLVRSGSGIEGGQAFGREQARPADQGRLTDSGVYYPTAVYGSALGHSPGAKFTEGFAEIWVRGDKPVTLLGIRQKLVGDDIMRPLGAYVAMPDRAFASRQEVAAFPPKPSANYPTIRPLKGLVLRPGKRAAEMGFELLLGYRVTGSGHAERMGITVDYEVSGHQYSLFLGDHVSLCAPKRKDCPAPTFDR